jgi:hypothetical protein
MSLKHLLDALRHELAGSKSVVNFKPPQVTGKNMREGGNSSGGNTPQAGYKGGPSQGS